MNPICVCVGGGGGISDRKESINKTKTLPVRMPHTKHPDRSGHSLNKHHIHTHQHTHTDIISIGSRGEKVVKKK
jgi:hypothetical protein